MEKSGTLHIYYTNKTFKHWKKRWLHLQDQQLNIYQGENDYFIAMFILYIITKTKRKFISNGFEFSSKDSRYKRLENAINIKNYRVSITNTTDLISHKGYTFKVFKIVFLRRKRRTRQFFFSFN